MTPPTDTRALERKLAEVERELVLTTRWWAQQFERADSLTAALREAEEALEEILRFTKSRPVAEMARAGLQQARSAASPTTEGER